MDSPSNLKLSTNKKSVLLKMANTPDAKTFPIEQLGQNNEFIKLIQSGEIETIHSQEATLDEIFIQVTGKTLV